MEKKVSRRQWLKWAAMGAASGLLSACAPRIVEKVVKETVVVEKAVKETVVVEKVVKEVVKETVIVAGTPKVVERVVEKEVLITPIPAPSWQGTIDVYAGGVQPNVARGEGLEPLTALRTLADEWEEMHPGVKIHFIEEGMVGQDPVWIKSRQAADTMPDIMYSLDNLLNRDVGTPYWIPVDPWINTPNPYIPAGEPGHDRWQEGFIAGFDARNLMIDKRFYGFPQSYSAVQVYVNKDILEESGVDLDSDVISPRWTFDSMLEVSDRIEKAGSLPWALNWLHPYWNWIQTTVLTGLFKSTGSWGKLDTNNDDFVTSLERFEAILRGDWAADTPEMRAMWKLTRDWTAYWPEGYLGLSGEETTAMWMRGEAAFMWNGTWYYPTVLNDPERDFDFAIARFPDCAERMAEIGKGGKTCYPGGACDLQSITQTTTRQGNVELCIDWLKYYLSCDGQSRVCKEHGGLPPVIKCAEGNPALRQFAPAPGETLLKTIHMRSMHFDYGETFMRIHGEWLAGRLGIDEALAQFQVEMDKYAKDAVERGEAAE